MIQNTPLKRNMPENQPSFEVTFDENPTPNPPSFEVPFDENPTPNLPSFEVPFDENPIPNHSAAEPKAPVATISNDGLCQMAVDSMANAYVPYSGYRVGAALLTKDGRVFTGCNIENASYTPTVCAERTAIFKAVSEGVCDFTRIAVCGGKDGIISGAFPPCGVCRQVMAEFCDGDFEILIVTSASPIAYKSYKFSELLPEAFSPRYLK